jgi:hypothetical protein
MRIFAQILSAHSSIDKIPAIKNGESRLSDLRLYARMRASAATPHSKTGWAYSGDQPHRQAPKLMEEQNII